MNYRNFISITADSRKVVPGCLFVAVKGFSSDGHHYIADAIRKGATGIICEHLPEGIDTRGVDVEVTENSNIHHQNWHCEIAVIKLGFQMSRTSFIIGILSIASSFMKSPVPTRGALCIHDIRA